MTIKIPENFMGKPIKGSIERGLAKEQVQPTPEPIIPEIVKPRNSVPANDPQNYIILPGRAHGKYSYPDTLVAMDKRHFNKNWTDAHVALAQDNEYMLTIRQFADFLTLLKTGKVFDGAGSQVDPQRINATLDEILTVRAPWRSEWLDAKFEKKNAHIFGLGGQMHINYEYSAGTQGQLLNLHSKPLSNYLAADKKPGIDLDDWLANANEYGLPLSSAKQGDLWYWHPRDGAVAWFDADSSWAGLDCGWVPACTGTSLGVRPAREKI